MKCTRRVVLSLFLAPLASCSYSPMPAMHGGTSQNAVDAVVQPQDDMRRKTHDSQEKPEEPKTSPDRKGTSTGNDNSA
jgi:hypothetical protein